MTTGVRVCVLGNSHLAALRRGWDQIAERFPAHKLTFFGAPRNIMGDLVLDGRRLVPRTEKLLQKIRQSSGGLDAVELDHYDAFVLYGLQFGPRRVIQLYRTHRPVSFEWREPLIDLPPLEARPGPVQTIPEGLFDLAAQSGLRQSLAVRLAGQIRAASPGPIQLIAAPGLNEGLLDSGAWDGVLGSGDHTRLAERYRLLAGAACGPDVTLHFAPADQVVHGLFTRRERASGVVTATGPDLVHTDALYGAEVLQRALGALAVSSGQAALSAAS